MSKHSKKQHSTSRTVASISGPAKEKQNAPPQAQSHERPEKKEPEWKRFAIHAKLLEDTHLGSGGGSEAVDALLTRDRDGEPVIWASHFEGVLRDAARHLHGDSSPIVTRLFGNGGGTRQEAIFTSLYTKNANPSRVWRSAARQSYENRAPADETLRVVEFVPKGTEFHGDVELHASDEKTLERLLNEVDALGHGRATGAGRVSLRMKPVSTNGDVDPKPAASRLLLLLRNLDPMCIAGTAIPGNLIPTLPFVPGRTLLGALAAWLLAAGQRKAAECLVDGTSIFVGDAVPMASTNASDVNIEAVEILPAPLALQSQKPEGILGDLPWWSYQTSPVVRVDARLHREEASAKGDANEKLKRPEADLFVSRTKGGSWSAHRPEIRVRLRNGRPEPNQAEPSLFAVEQIAERTLFLAEIRGDLPSMQTLCAALQPILKKQRWLRIGRSGAPVEVANFVWTNEKTNFEESNGAYLTLTSDLLVRDDCLRWKTSLTADDVRKLFDLPADAKIEVDAVAQEETLVSGFNGTARLWRLPVGGVRRGSVYWIHGTGMEQFTRAANQKQSLGERAHEGFGRFRIDAQLPGVTASEGTSTPVKLRHSMADVDEEAICTTTKQWFDKAEKRLKSKERQGPSLSQWQQLVVEIEVAGKEAPRAIQAYRASTKAGWGNEAVQEILDELAQVQEKLAHARMFLRWLRTTSGAA